MTIIKTAYWDANPRLAGLAIVRPDAGGDLLTASREETVVVSAPVVHVAFSHDRAARALRAGPKNHRRVACVSDDCITGVVSKSNRVTPAPTGVCASCIYRTHSQTRPLCWITNYIVGLIYVPGHGTFPGAIAVSGADDQRAAASVLSQAVGDDERALPGHLVSVQPRKSGAGGPHGYTLALSGDCPEQMRDWLLKTWGEYHQPTVRESPAPAEEAPLDFGDIDVAAPEAEVDEC